MEKFKEFLVAWHSMCVKPVGNTVILAPLDKYIIEEIKESLSEEGNYYIFKYFGNTIKIEKEND